MIWKDSLNYVIFNKYRARIDVEWKVSTEKNFTGIDLVKERIKKTKLEKGNQKRKEQRETIKNREIS